MKALLKCLSETRDVEADCIEFGSQVDCLAEIIASGSPEAVITPEIQAHLIHSCDCREEFEALITVLKADMAGELSEEA
jgi:hypothetical protein